MSLSAGWKVEIAIGDPGAVPNVGVYDTALYDSAAVYGSDDPLGYLVDVTEFVQEIDTHRGRDKFTSRFRTGTASVLLENTEGFFTPPAGQTPLGILPLRPGREVVISNAGANVFTGVIDAFDDKHTRNGMIVTRLSCVDAFAGLNRNDLPAVTAQGAGENTFQRMRRILDHHLGDGSYRFGSYGVAEATMQATEMAQSALSELQLAADSEGGGCWITPNGIIRASGLEWFSDLASGPIRWTVGGSAAIKLWSADSEWTAQRIINEAHYARVGGTEQVATNDESQVKYGRRTHRRLDLICETDEYASLLAERLVQFAGIDRLRITELTLMPEAGTAAYEMGQSAGFGHLVLATINTIHGWSYTAPTQIFGVSHRVTPEAWLVTYRVDDTLFTGEFNAFDQDAFDSAAYS